MMTPTHIRTQMALIVSIYLRPRGMQVEPVGEPDHQGDDADDDHRRLRR